jgi:histidine kinase
MDSTMLSHLKKIRRRLASKLILTVGMTLLLSISTWAYFNIKSQKEKVMEEIVAGTDRLTNTIRLGTHYAMMLNSRDDINQIIKNIGKQKEIANIRIYNKDGQIKFSNRPGEVDWTTNIKDEACYICHRSDPPLSELALAERTRLFASPQDYRLLGVISPIYNEPGCASDTCHVHPEDKKVLGALDVVVSLAETDKEIQRAENGVIALAVFVFLLTSAIIFVFVLKFVNRPIKRLIDGTRLISDGDYHSLVKIEQDDEMGQLALAINRMGEKIGQHQAELNKQRDEYQDLFERVPCLITVQDRNLKLIRYNREFAERFDPKPGEYCFFAYKGRDQKCVNCPVEKTFADGQSHYGEETGVNKDGTKRHWIFRTSPIVDANGKIVAAMEMSLDITQRKQLEEKLQESEKKYHEIFNNIPNPVFVLDAETLEILDCNESVKLVYGYARNEIMNKSFVDLFMDGEKERYAIKIKTSDLINKVKQYNKEGKTRFFNVRISPSEYPGRKVFLVTTSDITQRLETEQQLIQAGKMATLGEMATGVAHELNQPLSVIKTSSSFLAKKINKKEYIPENTLFTLLNKVDSNVDRASRIITHMRQFARKSEINLTHTQVNKVLESAFEIFSQQLKVRGIDVEWDIEKDLPLIMADSDRLEQVFINLLINARDAIEEKWTAHEHPMGAKKINLKTRSAKKNVTIEIRDTGTGIPKAVCDKIFEPFFTTKEVGKGTGLGLSISYGIVKDCGGNISVKSDKDQGACFILKFPIPENR